MDTYEVTEPEQGQGTIPEESPRRMLAVRHVARMLGVHESTVRMWADSGVLDSYRIGPRHDRRIPLESVMRTLEAAQK